MAPAFRQAALRWAIFMMPSPGFAPRPGADWIEPQSPIAATMRSMDWASTPLGPEAEWSSSLRTIVRMMLKSRFAMWMCWGPDLTFFCNDAYAPTLGLQEDWAIGARSDKVWEEIWPDIGPRIASVFERNEATWDEDLLLFLQRSGYTEETYHTFSYSPLADDDGAVRGMLCVVTEVTKRVLAACRVATLRELGAQTARARSSRTSLPTLCRDLQAASGSPPEGRACAFRNAPLFP